LSLQAGTVGHDAETETLLAFVVELTNLVKDAHITFFTAMV
jgi:hypothetical protein